ncbi:ABC transporter permease subunit [Metabacillus schmidteae]|uniref:ABC transporter permease subunit n=1 Tax=Metabacillus schmidteae TaxID=2730405 RepID=UPI001589BAA4|nr:ABC transporter permease subunit [Metabacillus schmidteae]
MQSNFFIKKRLQSTIVIGLLLLVTYGAMFITEFNMIDGVLSFPEAIQWGFANFYPNADSLGNLSSITSKLIETILISIASATIAAIFAIFFAIAGSKTTKVNGFFAVLARGIATLFRNIDVAAWAMILLFSFGQSSLTGYFALFFVSFGFLTRAFMEAIDEVGAAAVEGLQATGARYFTVIIHSVIPSSTPQIISWILFMIETNIRSATLVGILTGTGIGFSFNLYYKSLDYNSASLVVLAIVVSILLIEYVSNYVRRVIL